MDVSQEDSTALPDTGLSIMSVPDRLGVDAEESRVRKSSGFSTASDNMTVPDKLLVDDMINPYHVPHLDTPPKVLTMNNVKRRSHANPTTTAQPNGNIPTPIPPPNFEQDDDILTLANRLLALHQKVITLEAKLAKVEGSSLPDCLVHYLKIFGIGFAAALLVQLMTSRR